MGSGSLLAGALTLAVGSVIITLRKRIRDADVLIKDIESRMKGMEANIKQANHCVDVLKHNQETLRGVSVISEAISSDTQTMVNGYGDFVTSGPDFRNF